MNSLIPNGRQSAQKKKTEWPNLSALKSLKELNLKLPSPEGDAKKGYVFFYCIDCCRIITKIIFHIISITIKKLIYHLLVSFYFNRFGNYLANYRTFMKLILHQVIQRYNHRGIQFLHSLILS